MPTSIVNGAQNGIKVVLTNLPMQQQMNLPAAHACTAAMAEDWRAKLQRVCLPMKSAPLALQLTQSHDVLLVELVLDVLDH